MIEKSAKQQKLDALFMDMAIRISAMSYSRRSKVGALLEKDGNVIAFGWNGMPAGMDNNCEYELPDGTLATRPEVSHAEQNLFSKLVRKGSIGAEDATLYITLSPCPDCAKQINGAGVKRIVFLEIYRVPDGLELLKKLGVQCEHFQRKTMNLPPNTPILDINSPTFAEDFREAASIGPDEQIEIRTPQFERVDKKVISSGPLDWENLPNMSHEDLIGLGLGVWNKTAAGTHYLFPKEWYDIIPAGLVVLPIYGDSEIFQPGITDDDYRFGLLAYGFLKS